MPPAVSSTAASRHDKLCVDSVSVKCAIAVGPTISFCSGSSAVHHMNMSLACVPFDGPYFPLEILTSFHLPHQGDDANAVLDTKPVPGSTSTKAGNRLKRQVQNDALLTLRNEITNHNFSTFCTSLVRLARTKQDLLNMKEE